MSAVSPSSTGSFNKPNTKPSGPRILRACVVQSGKVIEEQRLSRREPLTIGQGPKNTFVIADGALPKSHKLFNVRGGQYELVLTEGMRGKLSADGDATPVDFASLKSQGLVKKKGDFYYLTLKDSHRGKVLIGDTTLIFQFVVPPPTPAKPKLPAAARGSLWKSIDWPFAAALALIFMLELPFIIYFQYAPMPEPMSLDSMGDRWAKLLAPELKKEAKPPPTKDKSKAEATKEVAKKEAPKKEEPQDDASKAKAKAARSAKIRENIAGKGILAILGTTGEGGAAGAVADVFGDGGISGDLDGAFDGISGVGVATGGERTKRGGGSGEAASIGGLATAGGGNVGLGGKKEQRVGAVKASAPEVDGALDSEAIAKVVRSRMRMLQDCYERELKRDPSLAGRIEIEFTIGESGRVEEALVSNNAMGSDAVASCIAGRIRRWRFPAPDGGSVTVNYPFIFTSST